MLQPLQMDLIPNFANVEEFLKKPVFDPETDGKKYSVPYAFGTAGVAVRNDKFVGDMTSWQTMWDPANKKNMTMLDDERQTIGAALFLLGYSINTTDQAELDEAKAKLIEQKPLLPQVRLDAGTRHRAGQPAHPHLGRRDRCSRRRASPSRRSTTCCPKRAR